MRWFLLLFFCFGCSESFKVEKSITSNENSQITNENKEKKIKENRKILAHWHEINPSSTEWTDFLFNKSSLENLAELETSDIKKYCSNYNSLTVLERKYFWIYFVSLMSFLESSHRPEAKYIEGFKDRQGRNVVSRGLLQISYESALAYNCHLETENELHNPYSNLSCGLLIMQHWIRKDELIASKIKEKWLGLARYWSIFRNSKKTNQILHNLKKLELCL